MIPWLVIIRGHPGSGKSDLAKLISTAGVFNADCIILDPDEIKPNDLKKFVRKHGTKKAFSRYRYNFLAAGQHLGGGKNVVWDQPFRSAGLLKKCIDRLKSFGVMFRLLIVELEIGRKAAWERSLMPRTPISGATWP